MLFSDVEVVLHNGHHNLIDDEHNYHCQEFAFASNDFSFEFGVEIALQPLHIKNI